MAMGVSIMAAGWATRIAQRRRITASTALPILPGSSSNLPLADILPMLGLQVVLSRLWDDREVLGT